MHKLAVALSVALAAMFGNNTSVHFTGSASAGEAVQTSAPVHDCSADANSLPRGTTRVYIALRSGKDGTGSSMADARDGSTVTASPVPMLPD